MTSASFEQHPHAQRLDALAAGDDDPEASAHVAECEACSKYVGALGAAAAEFAAHPPPRKVVPLRRHPLRAAVALIPALAVAAVFLFVIQGKPLLPTEGPPEPSSIAETRFKGLGQLAVVRERDGRQERFTGTVPTRPADRLRVEIGVGSQTTLTVALLEEDGSFLVLLRPRALEPGTYHSEKAALLDERPTLGWIIAGTPEAVEQARQSRSFEQVLAIRVESEP
jgi:hypothetical protein